MTPRKPLGDFLGRALGGRSQTQLADELGISKSAVSQWVTGKAPIPERYRGALRAAARPGGTVTAPPPRTTKAGVPVRHVGQAKVTQLPSGAEHVHTHSRAAFARELGRLHAAGHAPDMFTVQLSGFRGADSPNTTPARTRRIEITGLSDDEIRALATGDKSAMQDVVRRQIQARGYTGGFNWKRATRFDFESTL